MTVKTEGQHKGEFLLSEANGELSREVGNAASGQSWTDGRALKLSGGNLVVAAGTSDSSGNSTEVIVGLAYGAVDATLGAKKAVYIARLAEAKTVNVTLHAVSGGGAAAATAAVKAALLKLFIQLR